MRWFGYFKRRKIEKELGAYVIAACEAVRKIRAGIPDTKDNAPVLIELIGKSSAIIVASSKEEVDELLNKSLRYTIHY
jgi:hypothetical protein